MTLRETIKNARTLPRRLTSIFVRRPWGPDSEAELVSLDDDGRVPSAVGATLESRGFSDFLDVETLCEILEPYPGMPSRTEQQVVDFVLYYAENDAFPDE